MPHSKAVCRLLAESQERRHPLRFVAVVTDGGVDLHDAHYWADNVFQPNGWAPFCAKYSDNVTCLGVLKTGPGAMAELGQRTVLVNCLKWTLAVLQLHPMPVDTLTCTLDAERVADMARALSGWKTQRLEHVFCDMVDRLAVNDPLGIAMLRSLQGTLLERRQAAHVLAQSMRHRSWYERAHRLRYMQPRAQASAARAPQAPAGGAGGPTREGGGPAGARREYVMDELAVERDWMAAEAAGSVALLRCISVSREGRFSCPVLCGGVAAGLLPPAWPAAAGAAASAAAAGAEHGERLEEPVAALPLFESTLSQSRLTALNDKQDAASVLAACEAGQLPPWVRHITADHVEYIEFLPPHLARYVGGPPAVEAAAAEAPGRSSGATATSAALELHPVLWFRFTEYAEYGRRRRAARSHAALCQLSELCRSAATALVLIQDQLAWLLPVLESICGAPGAAVGAARVAHVAGAAAASESTGSGLTGGQASAVGGQAAAAAAAPWGGMEMTPSDAPAGSASPAAAAERQLLAAAWRLPGAAALAAPGPAAAAGAEAPAGSTAATMRGNEESVVGSQFASGCREQVERLARAATDAAQLVPEIGIGAGYTVNLAALERTVAAAGDLNTALAEIGSVLDVMDYLYYTLLQEAKAEARGDGDVDKRRGAAVAPTGGAEPALLERRVADRAPEADRQPPSAAAQARLLKWAEMCAMVAKDLRDVLQRSRALQLVGFSERRLLTDVLRWEAAGAEAAAERMGRTGGGTERRNDAVLQRLPQELLTPRQPTEAAGARNAGAGGAAAACVGAPTASVSAGGVPVLTNTPLLTPAGAPFVQPLPGPPVSLAEPPPPGFAAEGAFNPQYQEELDAGRVEPLEADNDSAHAVHLAAPLLLQRPANVVCFKAVRPENLMEVVRWDTSEQPNVDVQYLGLQGSVLLLPPGVQAVA